MDTESSEPITHWLDGVRDEDSFAQQQIWNQYFAQLVRRIETRLQKGVSDQTSEDIALSTLYSFMAGVRDDCYPDLTDRTGLWPLLVRIAANKTVDAMRKGSALKRGGTQRTQLDDWQAVVGAEPTPEFALMVAEQVEQLLGRCADPMLRKVAELKLEGYTNDEIAAQLSVAVRTVGRKLQLIRQECESTNESPAGDDEKVMSEDRHDK